MKKTNLIETISAILILLFTYTAVSKLLVFKRFYHQLQRSPVIGDYAGPGSVLLPLCELTIVTLLLISKTRLYGFVFSFFIMTLFTSYIIYGLFIGKNLPCSCGGVLESLTWGQHAVFNIGFIILSAAGIIMEIADTATRKPFNKAGRI